MLTSDILTYYFIVRLNVNPIIKGLHTNFKNARKLKNV